MVQQRTSFNNKLFAGGCKQSANYVISWYIKSWWILGWKMSDVNTVQEQDLGHSVFSEEVTVIALLEQQRELVLTDDET